MRNISPITVILILTYVAVGCARTDSSSAATRFLHPHYEYPTDALDEHLPAYDAYLTWKDYDKPDDDESAMYVYNGTEMGRGRPGLASAVAEMRKLPTHSRLLIYPAYRWMWFTSRGGVHLPPYANYPGDLERVLAERSLTVIESDRDHLGRLARSTTRWATD